MDMILWIIAGVAVYALARAIARRIGRGMEALVNAPYEDGDG